jgi:hypothetical protein
VSTKLSWVIGYCNSLDSNQLILLMLWNLGFWNFIKEIALLLEWYSLVTHVFSFLPRHFFWYLLPSCSSYFYKLYLEFVGMDDEKCTLTLCVLLSQTPGSLEGRVVLLDQNCASVWIYIYFFCTPFDHDSLSLMLKMLLRVWAILFSLAGIEMPIVFSQGGHLSAHCFLSFFASCSLACFLSLTHLGMVIVDGR